MKRLTKWDWAIISTIVVGMGIRIYHLFIVPMNEPFRLGGLFYEFSRQIILNNFAFPETIPFYSSGGIPFAYPPLSFYFQALLLYIFDPPLFLTVNLLPPFVAILSLPAYYWMIQEYTTDMHLKLAGLISFALMPVAYMNQIEAAGLAEAFGVLSLILYQGYIFKWQKKPNFKDTILAGVILGFCILSSPGSAYAATVLSIFLFIGTFFKSVKKHSIIPTGLLLLMGAIGVLISSPYWLSVISNHGMDFFISPFLNQHQISISTGQIEQISSFQPAGVLLNFFWNWLIFAGIIWSVLKRNIQIVMIFFIFWFIPREGIWLVSIPASILAGIGVVYILIPLLAKFFRSVNGSRPPLAPGILVVILSILVLANSILSISVSISEPDWHISRTQIDALYDIRSLISPKGKVIIIGNTALKEWGPPILQREVLNVEYGLEWQPDELESITAINASFEIGDISGMIKTLKAYSDERQVYLLSSLDDLAIIQEFLPQDVTIHQIASTRDLELSILKLR